MKTTLALAALAACSSSKPPAAPTTKVEAVAPDRMCVTHGTMQDGQVTDPTFRAVSTTSAGDAASITFKMHEWPVETRALRSGDVRHQLGLKLRAADGCNLVYVMWRIEPTPGIEISIKRNPGERTHAECGADGYTKVAHVAEVPTLRVSAKRVEHVLRARISGEVLDVSVDGRRVWRGALGDGLRGLAGPAGVRSDNVAFDFELRAERAASGAATCAAGLLDDG
jgi:hypothetical protein